MFCERPPATKTLAQKCSAGSICYAPACSLPTSMSPPIRWRSWSRRWRIFANAGRPHRTVSSPCGPNSSPVSRTLARPQADETLFSHTVQNPRSPLKTNRTVHIRRVPAGACMLSSGMDDKLFYSRSRPFSNCVVTVYCGLRHFSPPKAAEEELPSHPPFFHPQPPPGSRHCIAMQPNAT